jgi:hypothetical protein
MIANASYEGMYENFVEKTGGRRVKMGTGLDWVPSWPNPYAAQVAFLQSALNESYVRAVPLS